MSRIYPTILNHFHALKTFGIPKSELLHAITTHPHLHQSHADCLDSYFLLYGTPDFFFKNSYEGVFYRVDGSAFIIIYSGCTRSKIKSLLVRGGELKFSFRVPRAEYDLNSYVLVSIEEPKEPKEHKSCQS